MPRTRSRRRCCEPGDLATPSQTEQSARAWLYKIATNVCINLVRSRSRQAAHLRSFAELSWLQPYPDRLLDEIAPVHEQPDAVAVDRETIELAFLAALQVLPPRQRAALLARDVLAMTAAETAEHLGISVAAANSAVRRARSGLQQHLPPRRSEWTATGPGPAEREVLARFIDAHERCDATAAIAAAAADIRVTMPPLPMCFDGVASLAPLPARLRPGSRRRLAGAGHGGEPYASRGQLPAPVRRQRVPRAEAGRLAGGRGLDRRDHHVRK